MVDQGATLGSDHYYLQDRDRSEVCVTNKTSLVEGDSDTLQGARFVGKLRKRLWDDSERPGDGVLTSFIAQVYSPQCNMTARRLDILQVGY